MQTLLITDIMLLTGGIKMITRMTLRLKSKTHQQLKLIAEKNKRSINAQIEFILENFITNYNLYNENIRINEIPRN